MSRNEATVVYNLTRVIQEVENYCQSSVLTDREAYGIIKAIEKALKRIKND